MTHDLLLNPEEARVLGVLIEKSTTTPDQYPLSLNALVNGCNQKSNRSPVLQMEFDEVRAAIKGLREKQLAVEIWPSGGSRTEKYRHLADTGLGLDEPSLAVIGELLLRRAQMPGELRARASRMTPIDSKEDLRGILDDLMAKGMVLRLAPAPGSRSERYDHSLCGDVAPGQAASADRPSVAPSPSAVPQSGQATGEQRSAPRPQEIPAQVLERLQALESRVAALEERLSGS